ncbi:MAG: SDR family NAD(P)-dependent oxidoreductase [Clostridia bacterium]|nr:SDR family NAD(P)-dependent oxidoreductase [Clostridia bacterium]
MNIVITGGTSGLGKALVEKFEKKGDNIIILARSVESGNGIKCDIGNNESVKSAFAEIAKIFGNIDILINNAGYGISGATELIPVEETKKIFDVNFFGALYCIQNALPLMKSGAKIVNISSACALFALPFRTLYCASKSAVSMLSNSLRLELSTAKIQVCAICPGEIKTNFTKNRVKHFATNERYGKRIENATNHIDKHEDSRMSVEFASTKIFNIIGKKKLRPQYIIGGKYKALYFASKIFPLSCILKVTGKTMGGKK